MTISQRITIGMERFHGDVTFVANWSWEQLPYVLTSVSISLGAIILVLIIAQTSMYFLSSRKRKRVIFYGRTFKSYLRLFIIFLCVCILLVAFSVAAYIVGVNFWNIILGYGILALLVGYMFQQALQSAGAYLLLRWNDKVEEENYIVMANMGVEGKVEDIGVLYANVYDPFKKKDYQIPTTLLLYS